MAKEALWCDLSALYAVAIMGLAGYSDAVRREVEPLLWLSASKLGLALALICAKHHVYSLGLHLFLIVYLLAFSPALLVFLLYRLGYMGGADFLALLFIAIAFPLRPGDVIPAPMLAVVYSAIPSLIHRVLAGLAVCGRYGQGLSCLFSLRIRVKALDLIYSTKRSWWLVTDQRLKDQAILLEPHEAATRVAGTRLDDEIEATPGLPYVTHLALGLALAIILGDDPLIALISALT